MRSTEDEVTDIATEIIMLRDRLRGLVKHGAKLDARAASIVGTKLDEARLWLAEALTEGSSS